MHAAPKWFSFLLDPQIYPYMRGEKGRQAQKRERRERDLASNNVHWMKQLRFFVDAGRKRRRRPYGPLPPPFILPAFSFFVPCLQSMAPFFLSLLLFGLFFLLTRPTIMVLSPLLYTYTVVHGLTPRRRRRRGRRGRRRSRTMGPLLTEKRAQ